MYELAMRMEMQDRSLHTASAHVIALSVALGVDPKKVAQLLVDDQQIKDYAKQINDEIGRLEDEKKKAVQETGLETSKSE